MPDPQQQPAPVGNQDQPSTTVALDKEVLKRYAPFVREELQKGSSNAIIAKRLATKGLSKEQAQQICDKLVSAIQAKSQQEQASNTSLLPAIWGGLTASVVGGIIWAAITIMTNSEIGMVAWGLGGLCGFAVVKVTGGKKGRPLQIIAVISSVLSIFIGKYITFIYFVKEYLIEEYGEEAVEEIGMFSINSVQAFMESLPETLGAYDILWVVLAVATAWKMPRPIV